MSLPKPKERKTPAGLLAKPKSETHLADCMDVMAQMPDKAFDLAIVDPPYGIGMDGHEWNNTPVGKPTVKGGSTGLRVIAKHWDNAIPTSRYWQELRRVSIDQIVWGGNYFTDSLPQSRGWLCWDKKQPEGLTFSQFELAWTSLDVPGKTFRMYPTHVAQGVKIHPTQKPVALYKWLLINYAKPGNTILDTHLGSGSSRIAAYDLGFDFTGIELDPDYYAAQEERFARHIAQGTLFTPEVLIDTEQGVLPL